MADSRKRLRNLVKTKNGICHYCGNMTGYVDGREFNPTCEHIVPRFFGGPNHSDNYTLACASCNESRGNILFYCKCRECQEKILDFIYDSKNISSIFNAMISHNKPRVYLRNKRWEVKIGYNRRFFKTWTEAIRFVNTGSITKEVTY